jgi:hypothetical protein
MKTGVLTGVLFATFVASAPASAQDLNFVLDNQSSEAVSELYVSGLAQEDWGEDILGQEVLPSGEQVTVTIFEAGDVCDYDLRIVYEGGSVIEEREIDVCNLDGNTYEVTD